MFTKEDLDAIRANIASGILMTRLADGREVRNQSLDMLLAAEARIDARLQAAEEAGKGIVRRRYASYTSGL